LIRALVSLGTSFFVNILLIHILIKIAHKKKWYDPKSSRKNHTGDIPCIGGVGVFLSFFFALLTILIITIVQKQDMFSVPYLKIIPILAGFIIIHVLGLFDDFSNLKARYKLIIQILAATCVVSSGLVFTKFTIPLFWIDIPLGPFSYVITVFWIVSVCNAVNLIDGIDGLAGGISSIAALFLGIISLFNNNIIMAVFSFSLFGGILSFLFFNMPPAKIFMGDAGSLFIGFTLAVIPLLNVSVNPSSMVLITPITLLLIPILDTFAAIMRRRRKKQSIGMPDKEHLHHKLLNIGLSHKKILFIIYSISIFLGGVAVFWDLSKAWIAGSYKIFHTVVIMIVWSTGIGLLTIIHFINKKKN